MSNKPRWKKRTSKHGTKWVLNKNGLRYVVFKHPTLEGYWVQERWHNGQVIGEGVYGKFDKAFRVDFAHWELVASLRSKPEMPNDVAEAIAPLSDAKRLEYAGRLGPEYDDDRMEGGVIVWIAIAVLCACAYALWRFA